MKEDLTAKLSFQDWMNCFNVQIDEAVRDVEGLRVEFEQSVKAKVEQESLIGKLVRA